MPKTLALIHSVNCGLSSELSFDANCEATWFFRGETLPDYMSSHPLGTQVWTTIFDHINDLNPVSPALIHIDYWRGNVLWQHGKISTVVDWEEAGCGDSGIDAGYCLMELVIMGMQEEAQVFLRTYQSLRGPVTN